MGIKGLMKLINDHAPGAVKEKEIANYFGQKVAVDASMSLYQFLIAVRTGGDDTSLTNENGEVTSHLQGMFYRTIRMMDNGIKPVYVFDGKPPDMKGGEVAKRKERRDQTEKELAAAETQEDKNKFERRLVHVTREQNEEVKKLLRLMGLPVVEAPGEAEAQCAVLCSAGKVFATATEDMDAITFGTTKLLRHLTASASRKLPIVEIDTPTVLKELEMTSEQFIDLCVLCGCDYTSTIRGIGPGRAYELIKKHKSTEEAIKMLDAKKYTVPEDFFYKQAAALFIKPEVADPEKVDLTFNKPDEEGIVAYMCGEKGFNEERIRVGIKRLITAKGKGTQKRMEAFFGASTIIKKDPKKTDKKSDKKGAKNKGKASLKGGAKKKVKK